MPISARTSISIGAPLARVWTTLVRVDDWARWNPAIASATSGAGIAAGTPFTWVSGGFRIDARVSRFEPPHALSWEGRTFGVRASHAWELREEGGSTTVVTTESMDGWLIGLTRRWMRPALERMLERWLSALKKECEGAEA